LDRREVVPQRRHLDDGVVDGVVATLRHRFGGTGVAAPVVAPLPRTIVLLLRVVQDAATQRGLAARGVVLLGAIEQLLEAGERLRPVDEVDDGLGLRSVHAGCDVHQHQAAHQLGMVCGQLHRSHATQ
jgi:hypothetical protein